MTTPTLPLSQRAILLVEAFVRIPGALIAATIFLILAVGFSLGFSGVNGDSKLGEPEKTISGCIGWIYFMAWSVSFYPQVFQNWYRKSVVGLSFDYELYNLVGFTCYSIFNVAFRWSGTIQEEYRDAHDGKDNVVQYNDVFFALHAVVLTVITIAQCFMYERGDQRVSPFAWGVTGIGLLMSLVYAIVVLSDASGDLWIWLNFVTFLSYFKLAVSLIKYLPQVYLNWKRKSTTGWNIWNVMLDFTGGMLSVGQQILDSSAEGDWSGIAGDPVKFGLGSVSMIFDVIFMIQHYCLYTDRKDRDARRYLLQQTDEENAKGNM